jgi:hypothetical protein
MQDALSRTSSGWIHMYVVGRHKSGAETGYLHPKNQGAFSVQDDRNLKTPRHAPVFEGL